MTHSILAPSAANRWVNCTGSVEMTRHYPDVDGGEGDEGTAAHWVMERLLTAAAPAVGTLAPNGIAVTDEMLEAAEMVAALVSEGCNTLRVEATIPVPSVHPECFGTPDAWWVEDSCVCLVDLKYGHGFVDEFANWQGIVYLAGIVDANPSFNHPDMQFKFTIVQPRCYQAAPVRTWSGSIFELHSQIAQAAAAAELALSDHSTLNCGEWCNYCPAIHACPAAQDAVLTIFDVSQRPVPSPMQPRELALTLRRLNHAAQMIKAMQNGMSEEVLSLIRGGTPVPGFEIGAGRSKTEWTADADTVTAIGDMFGVDLRKNGLLTPIQSKALLKKKGLDEAVISGYCATTAGALQLVQSDESLTRRIFGGVQTGN